MWQGLSLATLGVLATAVLTGWFATVVLGFSWLEGLLLGSIVSSTDAAAVFSVLRSQSIGLKGTTQPLLELESGSNDPMAVFLTTAVIGLLAQPGASWHALIPRFALQMALGAALGWAMGKVTVLFLNRIKLETEGLYPVATTAAVLFCFGATSLAGGNGFLAVYLAGIVIGNAEVIHKRSLVRFHDAIAWMMQIAMFLVLGLLVFPSRLVRVAGPSLLIALFLMLVARPVAVYAGLAFSRLGFREENADRLGRTARRRADCAGDVSLPVRAAAVRPLFQRGVLHRADVGAVAGNHATGSRAGATTGRARTAP